MIRSKDTKKVGELCELINGRAFKPEEWSNQGVPIVRIQNLNDTTKPFNYYCGSYAKKHEVNNGDLLFSWSGTPGTSFGAFFWNRGVGVLNQHIFNVKFDPRKVDGRYFRYALNSQLNNIIGQAHGGVGLKHITKDKLETIYIQTPPLADQERIADILDRAEALRAKRRAALALLDELTQSIFLDMFGDPVSNPKSWRMIPLGSLLESATYGTSEKSAGGEFPVLRMSNITYTGQLDLSDLKYMDVDVDKRDRLLVRKGDVLFNRTNSVDLVGKTCAYLLDKPMAYAGYLIRLRPNVHNTAEYISAFLNSQYSKLVLRSMCKSIIGMANINAKEIQTMKVFEAPLEIQKVFSERLDLVHEWARKLQRSLNSHDSLAAVLQHRAFRGKL